VKYNQLIRKQMLTLPIDLLRNFRRGYFRRFHHAQPSSQAKEVFHETAGAVQCVSDMFQMNSCVVGRRAKSSSKNGQGAILPATLWVMRHPN
jgi:hypothetical protein